MDKTPSNSPLKGEEGFQKVSGGFRGVSEGFQKVSGGFRGFQEVSGFRRFQEVSGGFKFQVSGFRREE